MSKECPACERRHSDGEDCITIENLQDDIEALESKLAQSQADCAAYRSELELIAKCTHRPWSIMEERHAREVLASINPGAPILEALKLAEEVLEKVVSYDDGSIPHWQRQHLEETMEIHARKARKALEEIRRVRG